MTSPYLPSEVSSLFADLLASAPIMSAHYAVVGREESIAELLPPEESALASPRVRPDRLLDFAMGREAARRALGQLGHAPVAILRGEGGEPLWPPGVVGSIAHGAGLAAAVVVDDGEAPCLGVDIEKLRAMSDVADLIAFGPERVVATQYEGVERDRYLLGLFSAKEAIYKAFYPAVGRYFGFEAVRVVGDDAARPVSAHFVEPLPPNAIAGPIPVRQKWLGDVVLTLVIGESPSKEG